MPFSFLTILKVLEAWKKVCPTCRRELEGEPNGKDEGKTEEDEEDEEDEIWWFCDKKEDEGGRGGEKAGEMGEESC